MMDEIKEIVRNNRGVVKETTINEYSTHSDITIRISIPAKDRILSFKKGRLFIGIRKEKVR